MSYEFEEDSDDIILTESSDESCSQDSGEEGSSTGESDDGATKARKKRRRKKKKKASVAAAVEILGETDSDITSDDDYGNSGEEPVSCDSFTESLTLEEEYPGAAPTVLKPPTTADTPRTGGRRKVTFAMSEDFERPEPYLALLEEANNTDLSMCSSAIFNAGKDEAGRSVVVLVSANMPRKEYHNEMRLRFVQVMDKVFNKPYIVVHFAQNQPKGCRPPIKMIKETWKTFKHMFRKNVQAVLIVEPTLGIKVGGPRTEVKSGKQPYIVIFFGLCRPFISAKFYKKLHYLKSNQEVYSFVTEEQLYGTEAGQVPPGAMDEESDESEDALV